MNLTCMSKSYEDKLIGISYSYIFAFVYENERCFCDVQRPRSRSVLPGRLSSAHRERINAFTDDCYEYIENDECECEDIMKVCLLAVSASSLKYNGVGRAASSPDLQAEFLNTTAYLEKALVLEYLFVFVLLYPKRNVQRAVWRVLQRTFLFSHPVYLLCFAADW